MVASLFSFLALCFYRCVTFSLGLVLTLIFTTGLTGCAAKPSYYDDAAVLAPPSFTPPALKPIETPLSEAPLSEISVDDASLSTDASQPPDALQPMPTKPAAGKSANTSAAKTPVKP